MNYCIFCGSKAQENIEGVTMSFLQKNYPLCEYHTALMLKKAMVDKYDKVKYLKITKYNEIMANLDEFLEEFTELIQQKYKDEVGGDFFANFQCCKSKGSNPYFKAYIEVSSLIESFSLEIKPIKKYVDDVLFMDWIGNYLQVLANPQKNGRTKRCEGYKEGNKDNRCTNFIKPNETFCKNCYEKVKDIENNSHKLQDCLNILRKE